MNFFLLDMGERHKEHVEKHTKFHRYECLVGIGGVKSTVFKISSYLWAQNWNLNIGPKLELWVAIKMEGYNIGWS